MSIYFEIFCKSCSVWYNLGRINDDDFDSATIKMYQKTCKVLDEISTTVDTLEKFCILIINTVKYKIAFGLDKIEYVNELNSKITGR